MKKYIVYLAAAILVYSLIPYIFPIQIPFNEYIGFTGMALFTGLAVHTWFFEKDSEESKAQVYKAGSTGVGHRVIFHENSYVMIDKSKQTKAPRPNRPVPVHPEPPSSDMATAQVATKTASAADSNVVPIRPTEKKISDNLLFDVPAVDNLNVEELRAGYAVKKVIGGTCFGPRTLQEVTDMVAQADLCIMLNNRNSRNTRLFEKVLFEGISTEKPTIILDIFDQDFAPLVEMLNEVKPDIVFVSSYPANEADKAMLRKHPLLTHVMSAY